MKLYSFGLISAFTFTILFSGVLQAEQTYPGAGWEKAGSPEASGWSTEKLKTVKKYADIYDTTSLLVITDGKIVAEWGSTDTTIPVSGIFDSVLSALYGIGVGKGNIDISKTLAELGIDDYQPLTQREKQAKIQYLLKGNSGVYIPAESAGMGGWKPKRVRDSDEPGTFWHYNVWAVNALSTIFKATTGMDQFEAFQDWIAGPIGMEDYRPGDGTLAYNALSQHPATNFRISARDLARFGLLYLRGGKWNGTQIVPEAWIRESVIAHSDTNLTGAQSGYGNLWWVAGDNDRCNDLGIPGGTYTAGVFGWQRLAVMPDIDTVVVYLALPGKPENMFFTGMTFDLLLSLIRDARLDEKTAKGSKKGKLQTVKIPAPSLKNNLLGDPTEQPVAVYVPPGYEESKSKRYPVVYLLPDYRETIFDILPEIEQDDKVWTMPAFKGVKVHAMLDRLIQTGEIPGMIVVMPNSHNSYFGSFYKNSITNGNWEDFIFHDLVSYIDKNFRTIPEAASRGIAGHGMGGFGSISLSMKHPDIFSTVYGLSPSCLAWVDELDVKNPFWKRAVQFSNKTQMYQAWQRGDIYSGLFLTLASAFSPNPERAPLFVDWPFQFYKDTKKPGEPDIRISNKSHAHEREPVPGKDELVPIKQTHNKWQLQFPNNLIRFNQANLKKLNRIVIDYGTQDQPPSTVTGIQEFSRQLARNGVPHTIDIYDGNLSNNIRERLADHVFPFFARTLRIDNESNSEK
jgi:enterochelin esterase-like enzyme